MRNLTYILIVAILIPSITDAQIWKRKRWELCGAFGASNFLGDLGGADQDGTNGFRDMEFVATRHAVGLGLQYRLSEKFLTRTMLYHAKVYGADSLTKSTFRRYRNLSFRSPIVELSSIIIFSLNKEQAGHRYALKGVRGRKELNINTYFFTGIGVFYFNPKAYLGDKWVALQPIGTEGQGRPGAPKNNKYSRISVCIPIGMGFRKSVSKQFVVGVEYGIRKTFTDYIDDVSTNYYRFDEGDPALTQAHYWGGTYADPHRPVEEDPNFATHPDVTTTTPGRKNEVFVGEKRGDPTNKDPYMFITVTVSYFMQQTRNNWPKF